VKLDVPHPSPNGAAIQGAFIEPAILQLTVIPKAVGKQDIAGRAPDHLARDESDGVHHHSAAIQRILAAAAGQFGHPAPRELNGTERSRPHPQAGNVTFLKDAVFDC